MLNLYGSIPCQVHALHAKCTQPTVIIMAQAGKVEHAEQDNLSARSKVEMLMDPAVLPRQVFINFSDDEKEEEYRCNPVLEDCYKCPQCGFSSKEE